MSKGLILGRPVFDPQPYTRIDPIATIRTGAWRTRGDWSSALPPEGRAFARQLPGFTTRSLLAFEIEPNARIEPGKDEFSVVNPEHVYEVVDYRKSDPEVARQQLVEIGLSSVISGSESVVVALGRGLCIKVKVSRHPTTDLWVADLNGLEHLPTHVFDDRLFDGDQVDGRWIAVPGLTVGAATGMVNWCRDADFLETALRRVRKAGTHASIGGPTRQQLDQLLTQLGRADLLPGHGADLVAMRNRLQTFVPSLAQNAGVLDELVEALSALSPVKDRLATRFAEQMTVVEREMREALEQKLIEETEAKFSELDRNRGLREDKLLQELHELELSRDDLLHQMTTLAMDIGTKRKELNEIELSSEQARSALATDLNELLSEFGELPLPDEKNIAMLGARVAARLGEPGAAFEVAVQGGPPWTKPSSSVDAPKSWDTFLQTLRAIAVQWGYVADELQLADVAARAGAIVILPEECASRFVGCYSALVTNGRYGRHVLDPSVISLDDLWRLPGSGRHGCFARAWASAKLDPTRFQVVLLDGIHRTPSAFWMPSLLDILCDPRRPRNLLVFASLGTPSVDPDRAWRASSEAVVALDPGIRDGFPPMLLSHARGKEGFTASFDAGKAPVPVPAEVMSFFESIENEALPKGIFIVFEVFRAAWPFGPELAAGLARAMAGRSRETQASLVSGAAWLLKRLQNDDRGG